MWVSREGEEGEGGEEYSTESRLLGLDFRFAGDEREVLFGDLVRLAVAQFAPCEDNRPDRAMVSSLSSSTPAIVTVAEILKHTTRLNFQGLSWISWTVANLYRELRLARVSDSKLAANAASVGILLDTKKCM